MIFKDQDVHKMPALAITGGFGTGKSTLLKIFEKYGFKTFNADQEVWSRESVDKSVYKWVQEHFPSCFLGSTLDKKALRAVIFSDPFARAQVENIVHPKVYENLQTFLKSASGPCIAEIPLLYEKGYEELFDLVLLTFCSPQKQWERACARDPSLTRDLFDQIVAAQMSLDQKKALTPHHINTDASPEYLENSLIAFLRTQGFSCVKSS